MVQILQTPERQPGFLESLLGSAKNKMDEYSQGQAKQQALEREYALKGALESQNQESKFANQMNLQKQKQEFESANLRGDLEADEKNYETISNTFGRKFADIWQSAPQGGKTELLKNALEQTARGHNIEEMLGNVEFEPPEGVEEFKPIPQVKMKNGNIPKNFKWPDFSKRQQGYTQKEWNDERRHWRQENAPIFEKNKTQIKNIKRDELGIDKLSRLNKSEKLPQGFEKLLINPETGEFYGLAQLAEMVSPEAQEWVKEIARFQNRAKDAFGSRVTNFDLQSYMKQFPGLLNSTEGRTRILKMMTINNKLDSLYENTLQKIYQKYGLAGIPQEKADEMARSLISDQTEKLENEFTNLDEQNLDSNPEKLSGKMIDVRGPDGKIYEIDESEVEHLPEGYFVI